MNNRTMRRVRAALALTATSAALVGLVGLAALPASAASPDDATEHGGAARHDADMTRMLSDSIKGGPAKNVILLIGDGMGDSEITVARNYAEGAGGTFAGIDALPITGSYVHWAVDAAGKPNYASESASTASAWSTGTKTINGRLSVDYSGELGVPQATLLEIAKANGLKTGNVSTAEIQDATPGAEVAHISKRGCFGPVDTTANCPAESVEAGGLGSISEQLLNVRPDVTLGGGAETFGETAVAGPWAGRTLFEQADARGYQLVDDAAGLAAVTTADADQPVLGLFAPNNFPTRWVGPEATDLTNGGDLPAPVACTENPERLDTGVSLAALTDKAIDLLDNEKGFFLQVEGASIDKQDHAANACGQIGETVDLDEAVQVALDFAKTDGDTLVVVTADHAHTSQIVGSAIPGLNTHLLTAEGQPMIVAYGTSAAGGSQQHTGAQVRIAGYGPGAANVAGLSDQTDLFFTSANTLGLNQDLASLSAAATLAAPAEVLPGATYTVTASGLNADWQVRGADDLGQQDVLRGTASFQVTAPAEPGTQTVTLTGVQTGVVLTADVTVSAAAPVDPAPTASATPPAAAAGTGSGSSTGSLATTGTSVPFALGGIALALVAGGAYLVIRRHRRGPALSHN
ncbi:alkaline phosphatase [Microbacterium sp. 1P10UB]|uniref:alkaline phosphatase n=1 Tax=unclassified Microbacterium TaxID=2609290 RepID=UPI00399F1E06